MEKKEIRLLTADEIECRVATINEKGLSLLLYKDARVDQKILDETFTPFGWKRTHQSIDGNLYCTVEIYDDEKKEWIAKQDVGVTSYAEKEKGQASDSFKRACFNWAIGRELYTTPFIWIFADKTKIQKKGDKFVTYDQFSVKYISYNDQREIVSLAIVNGDGQVVYEMQNKALTKLPAAKESMAPTLAQLKEFEQELERTGVSLEAVLERYKLTEIGQMTVEIYKKAMSSLKKTKAKLAA